MRLQRTESMSKPNQYFYSLWLFVKNEVDSNKSRYEKGFALPPKQKEIRITHYWNTGK